MEKGKQDLLKGSGDISKKLIQITKTSDLLRTIPILAQMLEFGRNEVNIEISKSVNKCLRGLNIEINNHALQILVEDLTDKYKYDSIEDIQQCLKNGRRGDYEGKDCKTYGKLNMEVISMWMSRHLEIKGDARAGNENASQHKWKDRKEYEHSIKVGTKINQEIAQSKKDSKRDARAYDEFKANYEANKKKLN